ncbi:cytochrome P450 [Xylaria palmicola]|nr:cytochrome P450 [Xylaria palmicola]
MTRSLDIIFFIPPVVLTRSTIAAHIFVAILSMFLLVSSWRTIKHGLATVSRLFSAWNYLFNGCNMIQDAFDKSNGGPFEILAPDSRYIFVSSPKHIREVDTAADDVLSLHAASNQMLQPKYTMHNFNWFNARGTEGVGFVRALRTLLTNNLRHILPDLDTLNHAHLEQLLSDHPVFGGERTASIYPIIVQLVVSSNAVSFFGRDLARNHKFMESALSYVEEVLITAEIIRLIPKSVAPIVGRLIAYRLKSHNVVFECLLQVAEQRCQERDRAILGQPVPKHADCVQWIMETLPQKDPWSPQRVVHKLMAIWFGSVHALSTTITFAMHDICLHPEYVDPLRNELQERYQDFKHTAEGLPLLDSFIKESARLTPVEAMSTRRLALKPFTFSDGTFLNIGDWACTPVQALMKDPGYYPQPLEFRGFRFVAQQQLPENQSTPCAQQKPSKLTGVDGSWHVWGTGRMACPGRYYAACVMKIIIAQIIMNYDCRLADPNARRMWTWRSTMLPIQQTKMVFTKLSGDQELNV